MFRIGVHTSIAGSIDLSVERARSNKCTTLQIFTRNPRRWNYIALSKEESKCFRDKLSKTNIKDPLSLSTIEDVDNLRLGLANVDAVLQDISAIVNGYVAYKVTPPDAKEVEEAKSNYEEPSEIEYSF